MRVFSDDNIPILVRSAIAEMQKYDKKKKSEPDRNPLPSDGQNSERYSENLLACIFEQILIYILRGFNKKRSPFRLGNVSGKDALCYQIMNYVDTHIYSLIKLDSLSDIFGYNYSYLSSLFRKITTSTLLDYYKKRRLETARLLLTEQKLKITEISELLNYSSIYSFSKAFKDRYGVSPKNYK